MNVISFVPFIAIFLQIVFSDFTALFALCVIFQKNRLLFLGGVAYHCLHCFNECPKDLKKNQSKKCRNFSLTFPSFDVTFYDNCCVKFSALTIPVCARDLRGSHIYSRAFESNGDVFTRQKPLRCRIYS